MHEIKIPRLGWSMEEGTFVGWLKGSGDRIAAGDPLYELEGEKAIQVIEAVDSGILFIPEDGPASGTVLPVGKVVGYLLEGREEPPVSPRNRSGAMEELTHESDASPQAQPTVRIPSSPAGPAVRRYAREQQVDIEHVQGSGPRGRITRADIDQHSSRRQLATPRARREARRLGIDWRSIVGSGRGGRVRAADVLAAGAAAVVPASTAAQSSLGGSRRKAIASRLKRSREATISVTLTSRADATNLVALREQYKRLDSEQIPAYTDIAACLVAKIWSRHPLMQQIWEPETAELQALTLDSIDIGIAVDTREGLLVPVIRNVHEKNLLEVTALSQSVIARAREGSLTGAEMQGGVFTISNLGAYGIDAFTPVIHYPQIAILGMGAIRLDPVAAPDGTFRARHQMTLSLTFDHAAIDGAPAAAFLQDLVRAFENPTPHLLGS